MTGSEVLDYAREAIWLMLAMTATRASAATTRATMTSIRVKPRQFLEDDIVIPEDFEFACERQG